MAVSRLKTWSSGETLTASDLNAEFNNILNNGEDLAWPATQAKDMDGQQILLDGDQDTHITSDTDDRIDFAVGGFDGVRIDGTTASSVNGLDLITRATGVAPEVASRGEANIGMELHDSNGNEVLILGSTASAVNEITITNAATGNPPVLSTTGETNVGLTITPAGTGDTTISTGDLTVSAGNLTVSAGDLALSEGNAAFTSTDAGAGEGPRLTLDRNSASPAASDLIGVIRFRGRDSGANIADYAGLFSEITTATDTSEDGKLTIRTLGGGANQDLVIDSGKMALPGATNGVTNLAAGEINAVGVYDDDNQIHALQDGLGTEAATTSGTEHDFTSIRADARRITIMFEGVSLSGTDDILVQIGDSEGFETTGYVSTAGTFTAAAQAISTSTSGFILRVGVAADAFSGQMVLTCSDSTNNTWIESHSGTKQTTTVNVGGGHKSLSATLDRIRITRSGTDTFDAGAVNILVE